MKQPFENQEHPHDWLHSWRVANCEGCDKWSCFFPCPIWEAFSKACRSDPPQPIPDGALTNSGYVEGKTVWPCKEFKDYGYRGFTPGVGFEER